MKFSRPIDFEFEIERYRDKETQNLLTSYDDFEYDDFEYDYFIIPIQIIGSVLSKENISKEQFYSVPTIVSKIESAIGPDGKNWLDELTSLEIESIKYKLIDRLY